MMVDEGIRPANMAAIEEIERRLDSGNGEGPTPLAAPTPRVAHEAAMSWADSEVILEKLKRLETLVVHTMSLVVTLCEIARVTPDEVGAARAATYRNLDGGPSDPPVGELT